MVQRRHNSASKHHALVTPITAELQPLLPRGAYRAGLAWPARFPHWLLSSLLNRENARESLRWLEILPTDLASRKCLSVYVRIRVAIIELSDRVIKAVNSPSVRDQVYRSQGA